MQLNPGDFNAFLAGPGGIGQTVLWRRAEMCPCVNPNSGAANPRCPVCGGKGRFWSDPVQTRAGVSNQSVTRQWATFGQYEAGDAVLVVPEDSPMYEAGQFDRVTMVNASDRFTLVLQRGMNDRLNVPAEQILRVFWLSGGQIVEGGIPAVMPDGTLSWSSGGEPPAGTMYTVVGTKVSEYFVWGPLPGDRNQHFGARLPRKMVVRRFDLFGR